jgi:hypothetical protein
MTELRLQLSESGADAERLDTLTRYLRQELVDLGVGDVTAQPGGPAPPGARAFEALAIGGLLVSLSESAQGIRKVVTAIRGWLSQGGTTKRTVRLELEGDVLELSEVTESEQTRLIELFVSRHAGSGS